MTESRIVLEIGSRPCAARLCCTLCSITDINELRLTPFWDAMSDRDEPCFIVERRSSIDMESMCATGLSEPWRYAVGGGDIIVIGCAPETAIGDCEPMEEMAFIGDPSVATRACARW